MSLQNECEQYLSELGYAISVGSIHELAVTELGIYFLMLMPHPDKGEVIVMSSWFKNYAPSAGQHEVDYRGVFIANLGQLKSCLENSTLLIKLSASEKLFSQVTGHIEQVIA